MNNKEGINSMNKKGQFYLIAAIIIIAIIAGLATIFNYSTKIDSVGAENFGKELEIESAKVLDLKAITGEDRLNDFMKNYSDYAKKEGMNIYFIFGNSSNINMRTYENFSDVVTLDGNALVDSGGYFEISVVPGNNVSATINQTEYVFKVKQGDNFYFIISQDIEGEKHIFANAEMS